MDVREKLVELLDEAEEWADHKCDELDCETCCAGKMKGNCVQKLMVDRLISHGVTVQERGSWKYYHKQNKAVCTNCSFERDLDANFGKAITCPNCGAYMPQPPKGE